VTSRANDVPFLMHLKRPPGRSDALQVHGSANSLHI